MAEALPQAGWYDDPEHSDRQRYWDGEIWTDETAQLGSTEPGWFTDAADPNLQRFWDGHTWTDQAKPNPGPWMPPPVLPRYTHTRDDLRPSAVGLGIGAFAVAYGLSSIAQPGWLDASDASLGFSVFSFSWAAALLAAGVWFGIRARSEQQWPLAVLAVSTAGSLFAVGAGAYGDQDSAGLVLFLVAAIALLPALALSLVGMKAGAAWRRKAIARAREDRP